jgi:hypothetical protein
MCVCSTGERQVDISFSILLEQGCKHSTFHIRGTPVTSRALRGLYRYLCEHFGHNSWQICSIFGFGVAFDAHAQFTYEFDSLGTTFLTRYA